jgi:hypothetical protein
MAHFLGALLFYEEDGVNYLVTPKDNADALFFRLEGAQKYARALDQTWDPQAFQLARWALRPPQDLCFDVQALAAPLRETIEALSNELLTESGPAPGDSDEGRGCFHCSDCSWFCPTRTR